VIRLKANSVLQESIAHLLKRLAGRPPNHVRRLHASFTYQAGSWSRKLRVVAKVEWHPGELCPRVGFLVTNLTRPAPRVVAFCNQRGTAEQWIKEGKNAAKWTRLSCHSMKANAVRLQLHALAYNLANFLRTLALPDEMARWSLTTLREEVKIGAKVHHPRPLRRLPDGRGGGTARSVPGSAGANRPPPTTTDSAMLTARSRPTATPRDARGVSAALPNRATEGRGRGAEGEMTSKRNALAAKWSEVSFPRAFGEGMIRPQVGDGPSIWEISV